MLKSERIESMVLMVKNHNLLLSRLLKEDIYSCELINYH